MESGDGERRSPIISRCRSEEKQHPMRSEIKSIRGPWQGADMIGDRRIDAIETVIMPRTRDLGDGFEVCRALPSAQRRIVGPFVFFDQMGPVTLPAGRGLDVRPHPHIGLATVTYLFDGEMLHRDSLGNAQPIRPGR
jgi:Pirin